MKRLMLPVMLASALVLTACATAVSAQPPAPTANPPTLAAAPTMPATAAPQSGQDLTRVDEQGAVVVEITPLNLNDTSGTLDFDVGMNTHSMDLSMDLSQLATLTTDTGVSVQANGWDAPGGGHHVSGKLSFPATKEGKSVLEGATKVTITLINVDAPSRTFEWQIQ
jgi:hypothetical protein